MRLILPACGISLLASTCALARCDITASQLNHEYGKIRIQDTQSTGQAGWLQLPARQVHVQVRCDAHEHIRIRFDDNHHRGPDFNFGERGRATVMFSEASVDSQASQFVVHRGERQVSESLAQVLVPVFSGDTVELQRHHQPVKGLSATFLLTVTPRVQASSFQVPDQQTSVLSLRMTVSEGE